MPFKEIISHSTLIPFLNVTLKIPEDDGLGNTRIIAEFSIETMAGSSPVIFATGTDTATLLLKTQLFGVLTIT